MPIGLRAAALAFLLGVLAAVAAVPEARAQVAWSDLTLAGALAEAERTGALLLVEIHAEGCGQCTQLESEIWATSEGAAMVAGSIPLRFETSSTQGRELKRRYPITGTPTVLLLGSDGLEIDRIVSYKGRGGFLDQAALLLAGVDPVPEMEDALEADPEALPLLAELLEKYLQRKREPEADELLARILELDPRNEEGRAERALAVMARHYGTFRMDPVRRDSYWRTLASRFPDSKAVGSAVRDTLQRARSGGTVDEWIEWACALANEHPDAGPFQYSLAVTASRAELADPCLAAAARRAHGLDLGPARMDSLATVLEGMSR